MKKGRTWSRIVAIVLASVMLLTDQSVTLAADVIADTQTQDSAGTGSGATNTDPAASGEQSSPDVTYSEEENGATQQTGQTQSQPQQSAPAQTQSQTQSQPQQSAPAQIQSQPQQSAPAQTQPAGPQELTLTDEETGVRVIGMDNVLPEGAALSVDEKKEEEDTDYPAQAKEDIATKLEQEENLSLTDIAFYDINLGGGQPSDKIEVRFSVPDDWTGELDAWYIDDQGKVTNMDGEKNETEKYFAFQTDHFSLYALSVSGPKEEEKADEKKDEEQTAEPAPQNVEPKDGDEDTNGQTFAEAAEAHYGKGGTTATASATITNQGSSEVKTGETVSFLIDYKLAAAATYNYGEHSQPLFDTYDDTKIILHLPEGLSVVEGAAGTLQNVTDVISPEEAGIKTNDWVLVMNDSIAAASDSVGTFIVNLAIDGNGSTEVGHTYDLSNMLEIQTSFTIKDRTDPDNIQDGEKYDKSISEPTGLDNLTATTDDQWMVEKTPSSPNPYVVSQDRTEVTVRFDVKVGLTQDGNTITSQPETYGRPGRVPFAGEGNMITFTETPKVLNRSGEEIKAESITVTPKFGTGTPITFNSTGETKSIPVDTCGGKQIGLEVASTAPYYSEYLVEIVYPYDEFIAQYYDSNQDDLTVENTAKIQYTLAGELLPKSSESDTFQKIGEVTKPAGVTLGKEIVGWNDDNEEKPYISINFEEGDPVSGPVTYKITDEEGNSATLYIKKDGKYEKLTDANGQVTYDPSKDTKNIEGKVTVYMDPGTYTVEEVEVPDNTEKISGGEHNADPKELTITAGETEEAVFYNKETLGGIEILKYGQNKGVEDTLGGAVFGLYEDQNCETQIGKVTTGSNGEASFDRLPDGTYYVKEIEAPDGYIKDNEVKTCTISKENPTVQVKSTNKYNLAPVSMQKQYLNVNNNNEYVDVGQTNYQLFNNCFEVEKKEADGSWTAVAAGTGGTTRLSLGQDGKLNLSLPVYEEDGTTTITYRIVEYLPEGWHASGEITTDDGQRVVYTKEFTLENYLGKGETDPYKLTMQNDQRGSIELTKRFYQATASDMTPSTDPGLTASFDLYYVDGNKKPVRFNLAPYTVAAGKSITITDLPRTGTNNASRKYYLVETVAEGYDVSTTVGGTNGGSWTTLEIDGKQTKAFGPFNFNEKIESTGRIELNQSATISNVEQKVPVVVKKVNSYTDDFVPGARYTVYNYDNNTKGAAVVTDVEIQMAAGALSKLDPGHKYLIEETVTPEGYNDITALETLVVDLTGITKVETGQKVIERTIENQPDPTLTVTKERDNAAGNNSTLNNVTFEVYTKAENEDTFTRVDGYDDQPLIITSGKAQRLPAGTYYLKEVVPENNPNGILDPSAHPELYEKADGVATEDGFFFGPVTVEQKEEAQTYGPVINYSDKGNVTVTKYRMTTEGKKEVLPGAEIGIYNGEELVQKVTSAADTGHAAFKDLPIYDDNGDKITYTVKEISAPNGYTASEKTLSVELTPGETVTTDTAGEKLELINQPETSLQVTKTYYNMWEHEFTQKEYELPGTVIALYVKNADGNYDFVETQTTNGEGNVFFKGLTQKDEYVAIEVRVPDGEAYQYLEPEVPGKKYLDSDYKEDTDLPKAIPAGELSDYYYVTKESNTTDIPKGAQQGDLVNVENWAQLQIKKFVIDTKGANKGKERLINNAQFTLYMQIVDPSQTELAFNLEVDPESYTEIGSYSSGTLYDLEGNRMDGWFGTDVLKSADNVVYWLVETDHGIGADYKEENVVTLIKRENTIYKNVTTGYVLEGETYNPTNVMDYKDNQVTLEDLENLPAYGPGSAMFSTVRIAKWAGARTEEGAKVYKYTPLGNASFDLYLADSRGNLYTKLDTLTTGLDNNIGGEDQKPLSAWASSRAFSWKELTGKYKGSMSEDLYNDIFSTDEAGNGYIRVAVVESNAPNGYMMEKNTYYMYMFFENGGENETTEIFNDAYYVKGDHTGADKDVTLAEKQDGITWALYSTRETGPGQYELADEIQVPAKDATSSQYRLVNWPIDKWAVTVQKYGYQVQEDNLGRNSEELDEYYASGVHADRTPLKVTMLLETYEDGGWRPYAYTSAHADGKFTTGDDGFFAFPEGLSMGYYRITEVTEAPGYENTYDGTSITGGAARQDKAAYYFQVEADNVHITMYNPAKLSLSVMKTDMEDKSLAGTTFTLTDQNTSDNKMTETTGPDGRVEFENVGTGTYKLTETATDGYVGSYFSKYFRETYSGEAYNNNNDGSGKLNDLVNGDGIFLGYDTSLKAGWFGTSVQVTKVTDISNYGIDTEQDEVLTVQNPAKVSFTIQKKDADTKEALPGAQFKVEYLPFDRISGDITVSSTATWQKKETATTQGENGLATVSGEPGIYRITETSAPTGYDITSTEPQYVAMTGGLKINSVKVGETNVELDTDRALEFADDQQVSLKVTKTIQPGELKVSGTHAFTFTLYNEDKEKIKELTITTTNGQPQEGTFTGLSQGKTYYLKETGVKAGFAFTGMTDSEGEAMTPDNDDFYEITMPTKPENVSVTAENTYLYAQVSILKVDGEKGTFLDDAKFKVMRVTGQEEEEVNVTVEAKGNGLYTAVLPLTGTGEETFRFYETQAPPDYLPDTEHYIEVKVKPGDLLGEPGWSEDRYTSSDDREANNQLMLADRLFPNYRGAYVDLVKYDNVHAAKETASEQAGATFTLYQYDEETKVWTYAGRETTEGDGKIHFVVNGGIRYAVEETTVPSGYQGLEGIYDKEDKKAETKTETVGQETRTIHLINGGEPIQAGVTYTYQAYDIPFLNLEIQKENVLDPSSLLTAVADVYEVPAGTTLDSDQAVETFLAGNPAKLIDNVNVNQPGESGDRKYNYSNDQRLDGRIVAGKTYLVVETSASTSQIRENAKVEWYDVITVPEGSRDTQTAVLKNVVGSAPLSLQKTADKTTFKSLFTEGAEVNYTITPTVGSNTYPLTDFTVTDEGLKAYHGNTELPYEEDYLKGNYSLTQVTVGQAFHETSDLAENIDGPIYATVTFYDTDGKPVYTSDLLDVSTGAKEAVLPEGSGKAEKISISYECTQFKKTTGYALGTMFKPGSIQVTAVIDQQTGSEDEQIIDRVRNTAGATLHYQEWTPAGAKAEDTTEVKRTATQDIRFGEQEAAQVSVVKKADQTTVNLRQPVEYSITISNSADAKEAMQKPFLVDYLPQGTSWQPYGDKPEEAVILEAGDTGITFSHARSEVKNGETAVFVFLNGNLEPGESVTVKLKVMTEDAAAQYGNSMNNYVLVGSDVAGARTEENPQGASFQNATGNWAQSVDAVTTTMDPARRETLKELLAEQATYGYVSAMTSVNWAGSSDLVTVKSAYGDRNAQAGYSTDILSTVSNGGTMHYRLSVSNASELFTTTEFALIDVLPAVGDLTSGNLARDSQWALNFGELKGVYVTKVTGEDQTQTTTISPVNYHVYYYTGDLDGSSSYQSLYKSVTQLGYDDINSLPQGWTSQLPSDKKTIRAFVVALNNAEEVQLGNNDMLAVEYTAVVNGGEDWDVPTLNENSWKNAVNSFSCTYSRFQSHDRTPQPVNEVIGSNQVSNTIMPEPVKVGGHIWIDKNGNGVWEEGEDISNFQQNTLIQQMLDEIEVRLFTYTGTNSSSTGTLLFEQAKSTDWKSVANYQFTELNPGMLKENVSDATAYPDGILDPAQLKGSAPSTYTLNVTIPEEVDGNYKVTTVGATSGRSRDPRTIAQDYREETKDNNFTKQGSAAVSERFYLWATDPEVFDNTKDIGLVPYRDLEIHKTAADDTATKVEGAQFTVYGPFADENVAEADLTDDKKVGTYKTDANGNLTVEDLLWYQNYVIVEDSTAAGYELDGATAEGINGTNIESIELGENPAWLLKKPDDSKTEPVDTVNITNDRTEVKATLKAEKEYLKNEKAQTLKGNEFTFNLWASLADITTEGKEPLMPADNTADGSVTFEGIDELTYDRPGTHYYYITEQQKETNPYQGVTYDETIYRATVEVEWKDGTGLETTVTYEKQTGPDTWETEASAKFTNEYNATGSWTPAVTKTLTGRDMKADETFIIEVVEKVNGTETVFATGTASGGEDGKPVNVVFADPITYDLDDVGVKHTYTIREKNGGDITNGLTYTDAEYEVTVTVRDKGDGTLDVAAVYPDGAKSVNFTNTYKPEPITYTPVVTKRVTGNELPADQTFTFDLAAGTFDPTDGAVIPTDTQAQIKVKEKETTGTVTDNFGEITFKKAGTYTFTITEEKPTQAGFEEYDISEWTLTVEVSDDGNGKLTRKSTVYTKEGVNNGTEAAFTNEYDPTDETVQLQAAKIMTSDLAEELPHDMTFTFEQSYSGDQPDSVKMPAGESANQVKVMIDNLGTEILAPKFAEITFTAAGEYTFAIEEVIPAEADRESGVNYDNKIWNAKVKVTDKGGSLEASEPVYYLSTATPDDSSKPVFTNAYKTENVNFTPGISKTLTGDPIPEKKTFTFELTADAGNDEDGFQILDQNEKPVEKGTATVTYNAGESGLKSTNFNDIQFSKAGTYSFTINEITDDAAGYQYDTEEQGPWTLTVEIEDEGGALDIKGVSYADKEGNKVTTPNPKAEFTNSYTVTDTTYIPAVTKKMTGDPRPGAADFAFTIEPGAGNPKDGATLGQDTEASITIGKDVDEATVPAAGEDAFGPITFSQAGTYTFIIQETDGDKAGYTYDTDPWTLTVKVEDKNSQLTVTETTYTRAGETNENAAVFTNSYETTDSTPFTPEVKKTVTGEKRPTGTQTFDFTLTPSAGDGFTIDGNDTKATVTVIDNASTGTTTDPFGEITFTKAGTYEFQISEAEGSANGYTYDTEPWTLTVVVEDQDSQLAVTSHTYTRDGDTTSTDCATVVNTYAVEPTEFMPVVEKTIIGDDRPGDVTFDFELTPKSNGFDPEDGAVMPEDTKAAITLTPDESEETSSAAGQDGFGAIQFIHAGTYEFEIKEIDDEKAGYGYDRSTWILTVKVEDVGGKLQVAKDGVQYAKADNTGANVAAAAFENCYSTTEAFYDPKVVKALTGDPTPVNKTFIFTLARNEAAEEAGTPEDGAIISNGQTTITGAGDGNFGNITFDKAGTYHFTIAEVPGSDAGYTYDPLSWDLEVAVEDRDSVLTVVSHTYTRTDADGQEVTSDEEATFTNDYEVVPIGYTPTVTKAVTGDVPEGRDAKFRFALTAREDNPEGAVLPADTEVTIEGSGKADFGKIQFEQAGTYRFDITEINDKLTGYQYDGSVWTLTVVVKDTEHILGVESAAYTRQDEATSDVAAFENHYQPNEAAYAPRVTKHLSGDKTPSNATFTFTMQALADNPEGAAVEGTSASVAGAGQTAFAPITFTKAGTYRFDIREADGHEAGYTYDEHIWRMTVEVADEDGVLTIEEVTYEKLGTFMSNGEAAEFTNEYDEAVSTGGRVKTGDPADFSWPLAGVSISALFILILLSWRRKEKASTK